MVLGDYPVDVTRLWSPPEGWDAEHLAVEIDDDPCVWTDGSAEVKTLADVTVAGAGVLLPVPSPLQCIQ